MSNASRTYQTRLCQTVDEPLTVYASLMAHVEYHLFADIAAGKKARDLKSPYLTRFNITARQFNSLRVLLEGKIASSEIFLLGSKDESAGNQSATATIQPDGSLTLRLRLPDALASQYGKYLLIPNIYFASGLYLSYRKGQIC